MIADDRDDADDLRCNASDDCRIAGSSYVRSSKKSEFWDFFGVIDKPKLPKSGHPEPQTISRLIGHKFKFEPLLNKKFKSVVGLKRQRSTR